MHVVGLHVVEGYLKSALVSKTRGKIQIKELLNGPIPIPKGGLAATGLNAKDFLLRQLHIPIKSKRDALSIIPFQIEPQLPYPLDEAVIVPFFSKKKGPVRCCTTHRTTLEKHLDETSVLGIDPDHVSVIPQSLVRTTQFFYPELSCFCILHFCKENSFFAVAIDGILHLSHALAKNWYEKTEAIAPHIERLSAFAKNKLPELPNTWVITGEAPEDLNIPEMLKLPGIDPSFAVPLGLALDALAHDGSSVQLRQEELVSPKTLKRFLYKSISCACLSLSLATSCGLGISSMLKERKEKIFSALAAKGFESLSQWKNHVSSQDSSCSYTLTVPKVTDLLAWLSTHPKLTIPPEEGETLEINSINYQLTQYPEIESPLTPYKAYVELELKISSVRLARAFHESLIKGDSLVDEKKEIGWNADGSIYRTSFFLKPLKGPL